MGHCMGKLKHWRRRRQYRHKRFDFTPKRLWKYKDAHVRNEFHELSLQRDRGQYFESPDDPDSDLVIENRERLDSEEEIATLGEIRQPGRLVFTEEEDMSDEEPASQSPYMEPHTRHRSLSSGSEQIGRFEVVVVETPTSYDSDKEEGEEERSFEGGMTRDQESQLIEIAVT